MKAIQIAWIGGPEVLESDYVRTREQLTPIMDAVFGMYLTKDLEVLIRPAHAPRGGRRSPQRFRESKAHWKACVFFRGMNMENQDENSKRTSEIQNGPTRDGAASLQP